MAQFGIRGTSLHHGTGLPTCQRVALRRRIFRPAAPWRPAPKARTGRAVVASVTV